MHLLRTYFPILTLVTAFFLVPAGLTFAVEGIADGIYNVLWTFVNNTFGWFVGATGALLDYAVNNYIVNFATQYDEGIGYAVNTVWVAVRDVFNLTFIFGLVYLGFQMILNSNDANTRRWLIHLIMAALLVNFSLFITKFIVDFSNSLAGQIFTYGFDSNISEVFMNTFQLSSAWDGQWINDTPENNKSFMVIIGSAVVFLIASFVFAAGALMVMIRFVALTLYMVMSPLMFLGWVFPQLASVSRQYWSGFMGRAFFAPVYILLLYMSAIIINSLNQATAGNFADAFGSPGNDIITASFIPLIIGSAFMIASLVVANKLSADGSKQMLSVGRNLSSRGQKFVGRAAGGATAGLAARGFRNSAGRAANSLVNSEKFKSVAAKSALGRQAFNATKGVANSSFDLRQAGGVGKALGVGTGAKGGYAKTIKDRNKRDEEFAKNLGENEVRDEDGNIKDEYKKDIEKDVKNDENVKTAQGRVDTNTKISAEAAAALSAKETEISSAKEAATKQNTDKVANLENLLEQAKASGNIADKTSIEQQIKLEKQEIESKNAAIDAQFANELAVVKAEAMKTEKLATASQKDVEKAMKKAQKIAEAKQVYSKQIAFMKQLENTQNFWNKVSFGGLAGGYLGAAPGGTVGAATAGYFGAGKATAATVGAAGVGAGVGAGALLGFSAIRAQAGKAEASRKNLEKIYGKDGVKAANKKKKMKDYELLAEVQKDLGIGGDDDKDSDKKDDE